MIRCTVYRSSMVGHQLNVSKHLLLEGLCRITKGCGGKASMRKRTKGLVCIPLIKQNTESNFFFQGYTSTNNGNDASPPLSCLSPQTNIIRCASSLFIYPASTHGESRVQGGHQHHGRACLVSFQRSASGSASGVATLTSSKRF